MFYWHTIYLTLNMLQLWLIQLVLLVKKWAPTWMDKGAKENFEDTKEVTRSRKWKQDRQCNGQKDNHILLNKRNDTQIFFKYIFMLKPK